MGICGKIFIINLHNLQMLFMLWNKYTFSECLAPLHKHEGALWKTFGDGSVQARRHGGHSGAVTPNLFSASPNSVVLRKIFKNKHMIKTKILPPKNVFSSPKPKNVATGLILPKLCLQLGYFVLKTIRPRDVA